MKLCFVSTGGTGGHIFPGLVVAKLLQNASYQVKWVGNKYGLEGVIVPKYGVDFLHIPVFKGRNSLFSKLSVSCLLPISFFYVIKLFIKYKPNVIIAFGGYVSFPVAFLARVFGIPLIIHEQNAIFGMANRVLYYLCNYCLLAYPMTCVNERNTFYVGNPLRAEFLNISDPHYRYSKRYGKLTVLVLGGSLGATFLNDNLPSLFAKMNNIAYVFHQTGGQQSVNKVIKAYHSFAIECEVFAFNNNIVDIYSKVDLIICRSGAITVSEVCTIGVAALFIPYPFAALNHQYLNIKRLIVAKAVLHFDQLRGSLEQLYKLIANLSREDCLELALGVIKYRCNDTNDRILNIVNRCVDYE